ncbi:hypothetical protein LPTSP4_15910 [Leptospira ryugenii]|uniref:Tetratricopeptide repeat protein n=1 Tax=Leptospira ryugenii TaxID=1917863 RepID=A0A2P2DZL6_9LEPT|nr:hypothetical protein [Leptospira ryugenii]GBF50068.1 hypothetical protein LPTSP4_15910 [Leptospira ryugenii]
MKWSILIFFFASKLIASDNDLYKEAYEMEAKNTLFAIPLYENTLQKTNSKNLQKAAANRLFYLYKKHYKLIDAIFLGSRYSHLISSKEKANIWKAITDIYRPMSYSKLTTAYSLAMRSSAENYQDLENFLKEESQTQIFDFVFLVLYKRRQYPLLRLLLQPENPLANNLFYSGLIAIKVDEDSGKDFLNKHSQRFDTDDSHRSDLFYLVGTFYRHLGEFAQSARYFRMSGSFSRKEKGDLEAAKSLALGGFLSEACQSFQFPNATHDEYSQIFQLFCHKKDRAYLLDIKPSLQLLNKKEGGEFIQKILLAIEQGDI